MLIMEIGRLSVNYVRQGIQLSRLGIFVPREEMNLRRLSIQHPLERIKHGMVRYH